MARASTSPPPREEGKTTSAPKQSPKISEKEPLAQTSLQNGNLLRMRLQELPPASGTQSPRHTTRELLGGRCLQAGGKAQERNHCGFLSPSRGSISSLIHESKRGRGRVEMKMVLFLKMNKIF